MLGAFTDKDKQIIFLSQCDLTVSSMNLEQLVKHIYLTLPTDTIMPVGQ